MKTTSAISTPLTAGYFERFTTLLFWGTLSVSLAVYCVEAITDPDFWWHLKSGDVMLSIGKMLKTDPFNYTGDMVVDRRESVILKGYWLWQVVAALLYSVWGFYGIFVLRGVTILLMAGCILREMRRQSVSPFVQMFLTGSGLVITFAVFLLERPQIYSFIFLTILLGMMAQVRLGRRPSWMLLPLMVLWSNIHGGFVVGDIVLALFAIGAIIQFHSDRGRLALLLFWATAGIAASFANPSGWDAILEVAAFSQQNVTNQISEYKSSWAHFKDVKLIGLLWLIAGLHAMGMLLCRKVFWPEIIISVFLIAFGLKYLRNEGFIALSILPMTGWYLDQAGARWSNRYVRHWLTWLVVAVTTLLAWQTAQEWRQRNNGWPVSAIYPEKMAVFLRDSGLSGHLFSEFATGGYLSWALYPQWQTFIDTRGLNYTVLNHFKEIIETGEKYDVMLEQYAVDAIALNIQAVDGRPQPLMKVLLTPHWFPVYLDNKFFVLARDSEKNMAAIERLRIDRNVFLDRVLTTYNSYVKEFPENVKYAICYTELLIYSGRYAEAEAMLGKIERLQPDAGVIPLFRYLINSSKIIK